MINPKNFGLAGAILWIGGLLFVTIANALFGYGSMFIAFASDMYPGYQVTFLGTIIGIFWAFSDGFIGLYLLAWIYNKLNAK